MNYKIRYFAKNLHNFRISANLTQQELGDILNYSSKAVSKWESGNVLPSVEVILKIADIFNTDLNTMFASTESPMYFLGVDGGGTTTEFVLVDKADNVIKQSTLGPCNMVNMSDEAVNKVLTDGINETCAGVPLGRVSAFFGIAGAASPSRANKLCYILNRFGFSNVSYGTDAQNIVSAGLHGRDGIITILGTGSVVYCSKNNELSRYGGYGHLLGDYASGYEIGRAGLSAILAATDGSGPYTVLTELFKKKNNKNIFEMLPLFYEHSKSYIASFAPIVFEAFEMNDAVAKEIILDNVSKLSKQIKIAIKNFDKVSNIPLVISGGLTSSSDVLIPLLEKYIGCENIVIDILSERPVMGAVRLAKNSDGDKND